MTDEINVARNGYARQVRVAHESVMTDGSDARIDVDVYYRELVTIPIKFLSNLAISHLARAAYRERAAVECPRQIFSARPCQHGCTSRRYYILRAR